MKPKQLGRKMGLPKKDWGDLKKALLKLVNDGKLANGNGDRFGLPSNDSHENEQRQKPDHRAERAKSHRRFPENKSEPGRRRATAAAA